MKGDEVTPLRPSASDWPHRRQHFAAGRLRPPHAGHADSSRAPHLSQNAASTVFSYWHCEHFIPTQRRRRFTRGQGETGGLTLPVGRHHDGPQAVSITHIQSAIIAAPINAMITLARRVRVVGSFALTGAPK